MFEDSLMESAHHIASHRGLAALAAATLQVFVLGLMMIYPLLYPEMLPFRAASDVQPISIPLVHLVQAGALQPRTSAPSAASPIVVSQSARHSVSLSPASPVGPPALDLTPSSLCLANCASAGDLLPASRPGLAVSAGGPHAGPLAVSNFAEGGVLRRVQPEYPQAAKLAGIQGAVILQAIIGRDGGIENLHVLSGNPLLVGAATRAVGQWKFRPYVLDGNAVEVQTEIRMNFVLSSESQ